MHHCCCLACVHTAPEMLQPKPYTDAVDQWNVGVVAYTLFVPSPLNAVLPPLAAIGDV